MAAISKHRIALKSPLTTPVGEGFSSINVELRKRFDLYANVRPAISFPNTKSRYQGDRPDHRAREHRRRLHR